ncbi:calcineurin-like phosphoesterase [Stachybotrys elegans]|uniref:Calcineurin-like phosphoesterase n=1 Tax=Stachybotrys elegans TaxID=80388 RepID=A0A8K0SIN9_9HYPO|nr:calcineurin-like phosphoesterase [Stachybotrys elegans]
MADVIISDLHLEMNGNYHEFEITSRAPNLALLGDIGNMALHTDEYLDFLTAQLKQFERVFLVCGNHESYQGTWEKTLRTFHEFERSVWPRSDLGDFILLDRNAYRIPDTQTVILGCSLFSFLPPLYMDKCRQSINDFHKIQGWTPKAHNQAHKRDLAWLNDQVRQRDGTDDKIMILTHWCPTSSEKAADVRHANSPRSYAFRSDLSGQTCFQSGNVKLWAFGHTHYNCDFSVERHGNAEPLRLLSNQQGYQYHGISQCAGRRMSFAN